MAFDREPADLGRGQGELVVVTGMTGAGRSTAATRLGTPERNSISRNTTAS